MTAPSTNVPLLTWLPLVAGALFVLLGLYLVRTGLRPRRVGRTPHCPKCDYPLVGLLERDDHDDPSYLVTMYATQPDRPSDPPTRCPECGTRVTARNVVRGDRPARRRRGYVGVVVLLVGLLAVAVGVASWTKKIDWYQYKPTGWVIDDFKSDDGTRRAGAWAEIRRRIDAGKFPAGEWDHLDAVAVEVLIADRSGVRQLVSPYLIDRFDKLAPGPRGKLIDRWLARLADPNYTESEAARSWLSIVMGGRTTPEDHARVTAAALARQADPKARRNDEVLLEYLGDRAARRLLSAEDERRFFEQALAVELAVRPKVVAGDAPPYRVALIGRGPEHDWRSHFTIDHVGVDDASAESEGISSTGGGFGGGSMGSTVRVPDLKPGRHICTVVVTVMARHKEEADAAGKAVYRYSNQVRRTAPFEVLPAGSPSTVVWVDDPAMGKRIARAFKTDDATRRPAANQILTFWLYASECPANVAFRATVRTGGKEYPLSPVIVRKGGDMSFVFDVDKETGFPADAKSFDLVLRSDETVARGMVDMVSLWKGEITLPDIPITPDPR
ncbi:MAG TPA: hypothetical protein VEA69_07965 [Tepidisphaeraceae bacterium]|nr:hypothetical protein [Tepidisphaeraceae bacterium]